MAFWRVLTLRVVFWQFSPKGMVPGLKSLRLISCNDVSNEGFGEAIKRFPLLEELELSLCENVFGHDVFETVGRACPQLKRFRLSECGFYSMEEYEDINDDEAMGIASMTQLRSLQIFGNSLTNAGLEDILDNCPHLESLDIRHCFNVFMDDTLQAKCARIKALRLPDDSTDDYEFQIASPVWDDSGNSSDASDDRKVPSPVLEELGSSSGDMDHDDYQVPCIECAIYSEENECLDDDINEEELDEEGRMVLNALRALLM
uniref:F-box domain-containing protein n=1 Tax=Oryza brachyantha TaxID=4533 RepID=J3MR34_ORYBR